jgi:hypothetical protein
MHHKKGKTMPKRRKKAIDEQIIPTIVKRSPVRDSNTIWDALGFSFPIPTRSGRSIDLARDRKGEGEMEIVSAHTRPTLELSLVFAMDDAPLTTLKR